MNDAEQAAQYAAKAATAGADVRATALFRGMAAHQLGQFVEAEKHFARLYADAPGDLRASDRLAHALAEQSAPAKRARSVQLTEINARLNPRNPEVLATLGRVYFQSERLEEAEGALRATVVIKNVS
jgi:Flp pilus assembly protein TadD